MNGYELPHRENKILLSRSGVHSRVETEKDFDFVVFLWEKKEFDFDLVNVAVWTIFSVNVPTLSAFAKRNDNDVLNGCMNTQRGRFTWSGDRLASIAWHRRAKAKYFASIGRRQLSGPDGLGPNTWRWSAGANR